MQEAFLQLTGRDTHERQAALRRWWGRFAAPALWLVSKREIRIVARREGRGCC